MLQFLLNFYIIVLKKIEKMPVRNFFTREIEFLRWKASLIDQSGYIEKNNFEQPCCVPLVNKLAEDTGGEGEIRVISDTMILTGNF